MNPIFSSSHPEFTGYNGIFIIAYAGRSPFVCPFLYTNIALTSVLNGLGKTGTTLIHSVLGILLRISFVIFAIPVLGIRGYLYGLLLSEILLSLLHIYALYHMEKYGSGKISPKVKNGGA